MLEAHNIHFSYRTNMPVLQGVSVEITPGSFLAILGVNGCGKSTLLSCLTGIRKPNSGQVFLDGVELSNVSRLDRAKQIAFVPQHSHANRLTVYDSILLGRRPHMEGAPTNDDYEIVEGVICRLGLVDYALRYASELSGGEYQKMVLARAFVQQANTLLLDEPTNNLDPANQQDVMKEIANEVHERGIAAAAVMHDVNLALKYCDKFLFLKNGNVESFGNADIITHDRMASIYGLECEVIEHNGRRFVVA